MVVELPGLVADPEVIRRLADDVVEDHVVRGQDLVHAADRLEALQAVLGGLRFDVGRLVGQVPAGGMDALALRFQHARDRVLGEPVDLEVGVQRPQLAGDRDVAAGMAETDRRADVQRAPPAVRPLDRGLRRNEESTNSRIARFTVTGCRPSGR